MAPSETDKDRDPPWWYIFLACIFAGSAVYCYQYFSTFEKEGGIRKIQWVLALLYDLGGKWLIISIMIFFIGFLLYLAHVEYKRRGKWK